MQRFILSQKKKSCALVLLFGALTITSDAQTFTTLASFGGAAGDPNLSFGSPLIQGPDGNFYGTTSGSVFKMTPSGSLTNLYTFCTLYRCPDGVSPSGGLILGADRNFYGTNSKGGANGFGTVFRIAPGGTFTTLYSFCPQPSCADGALPSSLISGADGNFYGTTTEGGNPSNGLGTIFKLTPNGSLTTLYSFGLVTDALGDPIDGAVPLHPLVQGTDGNFYGTTSTLGGKGSGTVFKITSAGTLTTLYNFGTLATDGDSHSGLIQGTDGNFYGTSTDGGAKGLGAVFKITPTGALTTLYSFCSEPGCIDGSDPTSGVVQASDGNFYGTTYFGGAHVLGTIFKLTPGGTLTTLYSFGSGPQDYGFDPAGGLAQGEDGNLYGTTSEGGSYSNGTVYRLQLILLPASVPSIAAGGVVSASGFGKFSAVAPGSLIEIYGANLATQTLHWDSSFNGVHAPTSLAGTSVTIGGEDAFVAFVSPAQVNVQVPSNVGTGLQPIIVKTAGGTSSPSSIMVNATEPGLLAPASYSISGKQYVAAFFSDGKTLALPPGAIPGVASRRAKPGDTLILYGIGFGNVIPNIPAGQIPQGSHMLAASFQIMFGSTPATVNYAGLAPGETGVYQFNIVVPSVPSNDAVPLTFTLGGVAGTQTLYIAVQNGNPAVEVQSVTLSTNSVAGGGTVQGTVALSAPAPPGGAVVALSSNSSAATVPATVTVPADATSATFTVSTSSVSSSQMTTITVSYAGNSAQASLTVTVGILPVLVSMTVGTDDTAPILVSIAIVCIDTSCTGGVVAGIKQPQKLAAVASFSTITLSGQTLNFSGFAAINSFITDPGGDLAEITTASLAVTLTPQVVSTSGVATGSLNLVSTLGTISGSFKGTYIALR